MSLPTLCLLVMLNSEFLKLLRCPEDRTPLAEADAALIAQLNAAIDAKTLRNRGGDVVERKFEGGLIRADGKYLYPIVDGIPILLIDEAVSPVVPAHSA
ncbi:MAG: hypothetical protein JNL96_19875 [Planctomycetaceae bacterium]|nr:hypothetical protein [Planctomycetaceae bacterium]